MRRRPSRPRICGICGGGLDAVKVGLRPWRSSSSPAAVAITLLTSESSWSTVATPRLPSASFTLLPPTSSPTVSIQRPPRSLFHGGDPPPSGGIVHGDSPAAAHSLICGSGVECPCGFAHGSGLAAIPQASSTTVSGCPVASSTAVAPRPLPQRRTVRPAAFSTVAAIPPFPVASPRRRL